MAKLLGISGSLRKGSLNTALMKAATEIKGEGYTLEAATIHGIPLYDGDLEESEGIPAAVAALKDKIIAADGVILFTPEYNNGIPGTFKNAIDWLSRPSSDMAKVFGGKAFALTGASPGNFGTLLSQNAWLSVLHTLGCRVFSEKRLMVSRAHTLFDADGKLTDEATAKRLGDLLAAFGRFAGEK
ncbi:NADPH-dependent FMN reductase [Rhizobium wuzhouense]|uniref:NADPH-dependent FMN reductase n=1 Tax=Rhizobium wuzhouense TaxID=1986026 RepID=A0ABX5NX17_9HYPH|nr:NADPH-dependent FMN reductase [Rhizobium wuzhouense]PYB77645.1 NADPH-dependent FMN reductase [Rhizobium wuzhouense]